MYTRLNRPEEYFFLQSWASTVLIHQLQQGTYFVSFKKTKRHFIRSLSTEVALFFGFPFCRRISQYTLPLFYFITSFIFFYSLHFLLGQFHSFHKELHADRGKHSLLFAEILLSFVWKWLSFTGISVFPQEFDCIHLNLTVTGQRKWVMSLDSIFYLRGTLRYIGLRIILGGERAATTTGT